MTKIVSLSNSELKSLVERANQTKKPVKIWWHFTDYDYNHHRMVHKGLIRPEFSYSDGVIYSSPGKIWMHISYFAVFDNYFLAWGYARSKGIKMWPK